MPEEFLEEFLSLKNVFVEYATVERSRSKLFPSLKFAPKIKHKKQAIHGITLELHPGQRLGILGRNGAGKTTMMDVITGKTRPDQGSIYFGQY